MPNILWLLAVVPIIGALSLDIDAFVPFLVLFCVAAGLVVSDADKRAGPAAGSPKESMETERSCPVARL